MIHKLINLKKDIEKIKIMFLYKEVVNPTVACTKFNVKK